MEEIDGLIIRLGRGNSAAELDGLIKDDLRPSPIVGVDGTIVEEGLALPNSVEEDLGRDETAWLRVSVEEPLSNGGLPRSLARSLPKRSNSLDEVEDFVADNGFPGSFGDLRRLI